MQITNEQEAITIAQWRSYISVQRWSEGLLNVTGLTPAEAVSYTHLTLPTKRIV